VCAASVPETQWWNTSPTHPGRAIGLGLLWTGGYLTSKGAQVLYCPSNQSTKLIKEQRIDKIVRYDTDEPLWTSNGLVTRSDNDKYGDPGDWSNYSCYNRSMAITGAYCRVYLNYTVRLNSAEMTWTGMYRPENTEVWSFFRNGAMKLEEIGKAGIVSDSIDQFLGSDRDVVVGGRRVPPSQEDYDKARPYAVLNHDNAWNILFSDGAVKTYSDGSRNLFRSMVDGWCFVHWGGDDPGECWVTGLGYLGAMGPLNKFTLGEKHVWRPYFDTAYEQD